MGSKAENQGGAQGVGGRHLLPHTAPTPHPDPPVPGPRRSGSTCCCGSICCLGVGVSPGWGGGTDPPSPSLKMGVWGGSGTSPSPRTLTQTQTPRPCRDPQHPIPQGSAWTQGPPQQRAGAAVGGQVPSLWLHLLRAGAVRGQPGLCGAWGHGGVSWDHHPPPLPFTLPQPPTSPPTGNSPVPILDPPTCPQPGTQESWLWGPSGVGGGLLPPGMTSPLFKNPRAAPPHSSPPQGAPNSTPPFSPKEPRSAGPPADQCQG